MGLHHIKLLIFRFADLYLWNVVKPHFVNEGKICRVKPMKQN